MVTPKSLLSKFALALGLLSLVTAGCGGDGNPLDGYPREVDIEFRVTGTNLTHATIGYTNDSGGSTNVDEAPLPFSATVHRTVEQYDHASLSAVTSGDGSLTLEILVDGVSMKKETFTGDSNVTGSSVHLFP